MHIAAKNGIRVILDLAFVDDSLPSGGKSRSVQLFEIFANNKFSIEKIERPVRPGKWKLLWKAIVGILRFGFYPPFCLDSIRTTGVNYNACLELVGRYPDIKVYVLEGTGFGQLQIVEMLHRYDKKVVLVPANLESLAPYKSWTHTVDAYKRFGTELKYYRRANSVFCISPEETWLLRVMGCTAFFLPYRPPGEMMHKILQRRQARSANEGQGLFYFANFNNVPNILGLTNFIEEKKHTGKTIRIAGLGIEKVTDLLREHPEFQILGPLTDAQLEQEISSAHTVVINHFPTSGMLTRVTELILSGVAVHANFDALKAYTLVPQGADAKAHLENLSRDAESIFIDRILSL